MGAAKSSFKFWRRGGEKEGRRGWGERKACGKEGEARGRGEYKGGRGTP